jgi:hypothetical protein
MMTAKPGDLVTQSSKSLQSYQEILPHLKEMLKPGEMKVVKEVISQIKKLIKDRRVSPQQKVFLLDLFHECIMQKIPAFLNYAQEKILERLSILASKKSLEVFRDSNKSSENLKNSELFIQKLLTYIQIWAQNFGKGAGGQPTFYGTIYSQLRVKVSFPPIQSRPSFHSEPTRPVETARKQQSRPVEPSQKVSTPRPEKTDKETLDYLENLLVIIEEMENPQDSETGRELIANVSALKGGLDEVLNRVLNKDDQIGITRTLDISERINRVTDNKKSRASLFSTMPVKTEARPQPKFEHDLKKSESFSNVKLEKKNQGRVEIDLKKNDNLGVVTGKISGVEEDKQEFPGVVEKNLKREPEKQTFNIFDDILNLDIEPISSPPLKAGYNTGPVFPGVSSPFESNNGLVPFQFAPVEKKNDSEIEKLQVVIKEKDDIIMKLNQQLMVVNQNYQTLQESFLKTKELLLSKEKECEEFHTLKKPEPSKNPPSSSNPTESLEVFFSPRTSQKMIPIKSPVADNDSFFKFIMCEEMAILYDSTLFQIGFQIKHESPSVKLVCYLGNRSNIPIEDIKLEVSSESYSLILDNSSFPLIQVGSQIFFFIQASLKLFSPVFPTLKVSCTQENTFFAVNLKLPINLYQFASPFSESPEKIWQEWEDLLFASETSIFQFKNGKNYLPKLLKMGPNVLVFDCEKICALASREYLTVACMKELVFALVKVKRKDQEVELEVRSGSQSLRENMMKLIVSSLAE